jgi:hypothetical protein
LFNRHGVRREAIQGHSLVPLDRHGATLQAMTMICIVSDESSLEREAG